MSDFTDHISPMQSLRVCKNYWPLALRCTVTVLIITYLAVKIHWPELVAQLIKADFFWLMIACLLFGMMFLFAALRWWLLLQIQEIHLPFQVVTALTFIGQFFNSFLLGSVGGDIIKAVYLHKYVPKQRTRATLSIIVDRILGLFILISASLIAIPWQFQYLLRNGEVNSVIFWLLVIFGICGVLGTAIVFTPFHRAPPGIRALWNRIPHRHIIELLISGLRQHGSALNLTLASFIAGVTMTAVLIAASYCIGIGIGLTITYLQTLVILTVVICVISLPISIGGHGVREGIFVAMFAAFGVSSENRYSGSGEETAILFSFLFYVIPLIWSLAGGIVYLSFRHDYDLVVSKEQ
jgi:uncharacterized protein (TIRG00374 family)